MTIAAVGAVLLIAIVILCWRNRRAMAVALIAVMFGGIIARTNGPLGDAAQAAVDGLRSGGSAVADLIGNESKSNKRN